MGHQVSPPLPAAIWTEALIGALNQSLAVCGDVARRDGDRASRHAVDVRARRLRRAARAARSRAAAPRRRSPRCSPRARAAIPDAWTNGVGADPPVVVCGEHAHYAVARAVGELGLGLRNVVVVPSRDWRMDTDALALTLDTLRARRANA